MKTAIVARTKLACAAVLIIATILAIRTSALKPANAHVRISTAPGADAPSTAHDPIFFPMAVWYSGGKARAPMLETITPESPRLWKDDLLKIKVLGFNAVRTWVEWNVGEPREGEYHLENLDLLLRLADEGGLKVLVQVYV